jgi:D-alanyl-D-alanine carboxypeptidase
MRRGLIVLAAFAAVVAMPLRAVGGAIPLRPVFSASVSPLDAATRRLMIGSSWRPGCPVPLRDLRLIRMTYWGFDGRWHAGEMVVHRWYARPVVRVFRRLYEVRYPIRRMRLVDRYGADDRRSMAADNTSGFNCRWRAGICCRWSQHAYGRAIDVNPVENPFLWSGGVSPPEGRAYLDRSRHRPGMIHLRDPVWWAFHAIGWGWGGTWTGTDRDYQHFSANGR